MKIYKSTEDYLEQIFMLQQSQTEVRSIDIANRMNFSRASVSIAMKKLKANGYIFIHENGVIEFTDKGRQRATQVLERHEIIAQTLMALGVEKTTAYNDACRIEHDISEESYTIIKKHYLDHASKLKR